MICSQCNKEFIQSRSTQKNCSKECSRESIKKYQQSDKFKIAVKKYQQSDKGKIAVKKHQQSDKFKIALKKYRQSDKGKIAVKKHQQSDKGKIAVKKYQQSDKSKVAQKRYFQSDKGKIAVKKYNQTNKFKIAVKKHQQSDKFKVSKKKYQQSDKGKIAIASNHLYKMKTNPIYKITTTVRARLNVFLWHTNKKLTKKNRTLKMVGCTPDFLKEYLEKQFKPGMTWQNHGVTGWHVDHIKPLASAKTSDDVEKLMHYTNLQPLWAAENIRKKDKII